MMIGTMRGYGIEADWHTLLKQASDTSSEYFDRAVDKIDKTFGQGYAQDHPDLIAAYMRVAAMDFNTTCNSINRQEFCEKIDQVLSFVERNSS